MKSCRVQPHSMDGTMDCRGNPVGEHDSAHLSQPDFGWSLPPDFKVNPRHPARIIPLRDMTSKRLEPGHHANAMRCGVRKEYPQKGSSESELGWTGRVTSRRSFVISLLVASIREPAAALRQSGPASSAWQEHHELPLICPLHGLPTGCTTCGLE